MRRAILPPIAALLASCGLAPRDPVAPVPADTEPAAAGAARETLVLLPGRGERLGDFRRHGIIAMAAELRPDARVVAPDLHLGYYLGRTAVERLRRDVVLPARSRGERVTLAGVSLGGLGALMFALEHPAEVDEILLLAPFVGEDEVIGEIRAAGGLDRWSPALPLADGDFQRGLWLRIREQWTAGAARPPIRLAVGRRDRLLPGSRLLRDELLGPGDCVEVAGGHDWRAWRRGFRLLLPPRRPPSGQPVRTPSDLLRVCFDADQPPCRTGAAGLASPGPRRQREDHPS